MRLRDELLHVVEHRLARQLHVEHRARERARGVEDPALLGEELLQPPARDVGEREQPQRLAGRRAVDDEHVVLAALVMALDRQQREQLVGAGRHGELVGGDAVDAALDEHLAGPVLHRGPVGLELVLRGDLLRPQARRRSRPAASAELRRPARRPASAPDRSRRRASGRRRRRSGGRSRRRPTSCPRRPCRCTGSCGRASAARVYAGDACPAGPSSCSSSAPARSASSPAAATTPTTSTRSSPRPSARARTSRADASTSRCASTPRASQQLQGPIGAAPHRPVRVDRSRPSCRSFDFTAVGRRRRPADQGRRGLDRRQGLPQAPGPGLRRSATSSTSSSRTATPRPRSATRSRRAATAAASPRWASTRRRWLTDAEKVGEEEVGGAETTHITGKVDVPKFLEDVNRILARSNPQQQTDPCAEEKESEAKPEQGRASSPRTTARRSPTRSRTRASTSGPATRTARCAA